MELIELEDNDFDILQKIYKEQQKYHYDLDAPNKDEFLDDDISHFKHYMLEETDYFVYAYADNDFVIAFVACTCDLDGYIEDMFVTERFRGCGFGSRLMKKLIDDLTQLGYDNLFVHITKGNERAFSFYYKFGFTLDKRDESGYIFKLKLN